MYEKNNVYRTISSVLSTLQISHRSISLYLETAHELIIKVTSTRTSGRHFKYQTLRQMTSRTAHAASCPLRCARTRATTRGVPITCSACGCAPHMRLLPSSARAVTHAWRQSTAAAGGYNKWVILQHVLHQIYFCNIQMKHLQYT
jgi:hypothetical protein